MESLNRLKDIHENEVRGECHGVGVHSPHLGQLGVLLHDTSNSCQTRGPCLPGPNTES